jgi:regulator of sirC expression with transglutaminase-like and TPR domain
MEEAAGAVHPPTKPLRRPIMSTSDALHVFTAEVRRSDAELDLGRAALLIAAGEYSDLSIETAHALLEEIAAGVASGISPSMSPRERAHAISRRLFHDLDFRGNEEEYYDPRNSYLNDVLIRRRGIPITLSAVYLEIARRVGLEAHGVSYPVHFLVKYHDEGQEWIVDPFHNGGEVSGEYIRAGLEAKGWPPRQIDYMLSGVTRRQMLSRMLLNLKHIYVHADDLTRALRIQEFLLAINPWSFSDIRDRGLLREQTGDVAGALADLETYLEHAGPAEDLLAVREVVDRLRGGG